MLKLDLWKLLLDLKSIASDILRYIFEPAEWIRYIAIYFNLPSEYDTWPADKPPIYLQKSFISSDYGDGDGEVNYIQNSQECDNLKLSLRLSDVK